MIKRVPCFLWQALKKIRAYLTRVKRLAQPLICNRFKKMVDAHSRNIGNRNKLDMPSGQLPWAVRFWNDFAESLGNKENVKQLTVNPLLSPPGAYFFSSTFERGLNRGFTVRLKWRGVISLFQFFSNKFHIL